ncbi:hypothetical protein JCM14469_43470 [Desulfatiferula olefinivorans]
MANPIDLNLTDSNEIHFLSNTLIEIPENPIITSFDKRLMTIGSCFANHFHWLLSRIGLSVFNNPCSLHFSASSILQLLKKLRKSSDYTNADVIDYKDPETPRFQCPYIARELYTGKSESEFINRLNGHSEAFLQNLKTSDIISITLGTDTHLREKQNGRIIAHACGLSNDRYTPEESRVEQIISDLFEIKEHINAIRNNKECDIIVTLSPQRYHWWKDCVTDASFLVRSNLSKAKLRTAIDVFCKGTNAIYFPSYDIVIDELRLYESFQNRIDDVCHISNASANYVMNRFLYSQCSTDMINALQFRSRVLSPRGLLQRWRIYKNRRISNEELDSFIEKAREYLFKVNSQSIVKELYSQFGLCGFPSWSEKMKTDDDFKTIL